MAADTPGPTGGVRGKRSGGRHYPTLSLLGVVALLPGLLGRESHLNPTIEVEEDSEPPSWIAETPSNAGLRGPYVCAAEAEAFQKPESCNTCVACCSDAYATNQSLCDTCVRTKCTTLPWKGADNARPRIHFSPSCMRGGGWHDIAASIEHKGVYHVFMGCSSVMGGWGHAVSTDLVTFHSVAGAPRRIHESYGGYESFDTPCAGFVVPDEDGFPCAGFRQCVSSKGLNNDSQHIWNSPIEIRCAYDDMLTQWDRSQFVLNVSYWRFLEYDPPRPWRDEDGTWNMLLAFDACNGTNVTKGSKFPDWCAGGGLVRRYTSPFLRGPYANWQPQGDVFSSNQTVLDDLTTHIEFITMDYIGGLPGDPTNGSARVFLDNSIGRTSYRVGHENHSTGQFEPTSMGMLDWGSFDPFSVQEYGASSLTTNPFTWSLSMARTMGGNTVTGDQVTESGRRIMMAWLASSSPSLSLARDLTLGGDASSPELLQAFIPELKKLRLSDEPHVTGSNSRSNRRPLLRQITRPAGATGLRVEIVAKFILSRSPGPAEDKLQAPFGVAVLGAPNGLFRTTIGVEPQSGLFMVDATQQQGARNAAPLPNLNATNATEISMHIIVDHSIIEVIVNNRTAITSFVTPNCGDVGDDVCDVWLYGVDDEDVQGLVNVWYLGEANAN